MKIPFTNYDLRISKRGIKVLKNGQLLNFVDWYKGEGFMYATTPVLENIYTSIATEFAKIDLKYVKIDHNGNIQLQRGQLSYVVSERPNPYQSAFDFKFVAMYQLLKYGNFYAYIQRDARDQCVALVPIDCADYVMGSTLFEIDDTGVLWVKLKACSTGEITPIRYDDIIHMRLNPNNMFNGELGASFDSTSPIVRLFDTSLSKLLEELNQSGTIYGVVSLGKQSGGWKSTAMASEDSKRAKQKEIVERIKSTQGNILVLDAGEEWQQLSRPFDTTSTESVDKFIQYLYEFNSISQKIVNGTATFQEMEVFFYRTVAPRIDQLTMEMNYKIFSDQARAKGNRIEWYRNPFEYVPINTAIDVAYKGAMDITTNERRRLIYKLPPVEGGDTLMENKNFQAVVNQNVNDGKEDKE